MRLLIALFAIAMMSVAIGCNPAEESTPKTTTPPEKTSATKPSIDTSEAAVTPDTSNMQEVSLKLPGMTWGGCAASVKGALSKVEGITDIDCDTSNTTCTFKAPKDLDVESKLNEIVESGNKHVEGWSRN